jgi:hypothetical protein
VGPCMNGHSFTPSCRPGVLLLLLYAKCIFLKEKLHVFIHNYFEV